MKNQPHFDLAAALENWQTELAAQPNFSADDRRELETHLRDTFAELKSRGLSEEEAFWLARRRVGQPQKLAEEFVKADPTQAWRDRVFWMAVALLAIKLWSDSSLYFYDLTICAVFGGLPPANHSGLEIPVLTNEYFRLLFSWSPILVCPLILAKGWAGSIYSGIQIFFRSRLRLVLTTLSAVLVNCGLLVLFSWPGLTRDPNDNLFWAGLWSHFRFELFSRIVWPVLLIMLLWWLVSTQNRPATKRV
jgi:hypothetical protein